MSYNHIEPQSLNIHKHAYDHNHIIYENIYKPIKKLYLHNEANLIISER